MEIVRIIKARGLDVSVRQPFLHSTIMSAVILMTAACTSTTEQIEQPSNAALAMPTTSIFGEKLGRPGFGLPAGLPRSALLERALSDLLGRTGSTTYHVSAVNWTKSGSVSLAAIYRIRGYRPLWVSDDGYLTGRGRLLMERLANAGTEALDPADYQLDIVNRALAQGDSVALAATEVMLSEALMRYSADLQGRPDRDIHLIGRAASAPDFGAFLNALAPADAAYIRLRNALATYKEIAVAGGWEPVRGAANLRIGKSDERVPALRRHLVLTGDLAGNTPPDESRYDRELDAAVKQFQWRHGLEADGVVGVETLAALNVPATTRAAQIAENLRLLREPQYQFGERAIVVNVAAFELTVIDGGKEVFRSRTIVGEPGRETPRLVSELKWLEINPTWSVPERIAVEEIMPQLRLNGADYLNKRGIRLYDWNWRELDATTFDMTAFDGDSLPFKLRQDPGPRNPLGNVKFMFPNEEEIYLHDTRQRRLFEQQNRALSHGCVRVDGAAQLAAFLLAEEGWTADRYDRVLKSGETYRVKLSNPMPIFIVTRTAWVDADNNVQFRNDPYEGDKILELVLK